MPAKVEAGLQRLYIRKKIVVVDAHPKKGRQFLLLLISTTDASSDNVTFLIGSIYTKNIDFDRMNLRAGLRNLSLR